MCFMSVSFRGRASFDAICAHYAPPPALYCPAAEAPHSLKSLIICRTCCQQLSAEAFSSSKEKQL